MGLPLARQLSVAVVASVAVSVTLAACGGSRQVAPSATPVGGRSAACGRPPPVAAGSDRTQQVAVDPSWSSGARVRTAIVHVPAGYRPDRSTPVVLEFHGAGPDATSAGYEQASPLHALSDQQGFLDVFPQGLRMPNGNLGWNAYGPVLTPIAELRFVDRLLDSVAATFCVDRRRVYASGFSNGANMVNYVACRDAGRFAAVAPVNGPMFGQDDGPCRPSRPVPLLDIHSVDDPAVPYVGHPGPPRYDFPLPSVPAWLDGWAGLDHCRVVASAVADPGPHAWSDCTGGARIVAWTTTTGHAWPSVLGDRPAAQAVWSFLSSFSLPTTGGIPPYQRGVPPGLGGAARAAWLAPVGPERPSVAFRVPQREVP